MFSVFAFKTPAYEPPASAWESIDNRINAEGAPALSRTSLQGLPEYVPPEGLWDRIRTRLDEPSDNVHVTGVRWKVAAGIAASIAVLLFAVWQLNSGDTPAAEYEVSYSTEMVEDRLLEQDWARDEAEFRRFHELCDSKSFICDHPEFQVLKRDLEELTSAREAIESAMGEYGANPGLISQIKEIELERTDLLKKMMVMLI